MNHHGYGYYDHIIYCIICYPIVMVNSHYTVPDALYLDMQLTGKLIGSVDTIICGLDLYCNSCTYAPMLKI